MSPMREYYKKKRLDKEKILKKQSDEKKKLGNVANATVDPRITKEITKRADNNQKGPIKKGPVVTPKMIRDAGVTNLRDYYNKKKGLVRKKDVTTKVATGAMLGNTKLNDAQRNVVINKKKDTTKDNNIKKVVGKNSMYSEDTSKAGKITEPTDRKTAPKKEGSWLDKVIKETKRNFEGDSEKKTGRYKSVSTGKTNYKSDGGKIKMAKGYSAGGRIFTGR